MATKLVGVDDANPVLPAGVVGATAAPVDEPLAATGRLVSPAGLNAALPRRDIRGFSEGVGQGDPAIDHAAIVGTDAEVAANGGTLWLPGLATDVPLEIEDVTLTKSPHTVWEGVGNNPITGVPGTRIRYTGEDAAIEIDGGGAGTNKRGQLRGVRISYAGALGAATTSVGVRVVDQAQDHHFRDVMTSSFGIGFDIDNSAAMYFRSIYTVSSKIYGIRLTDSSDCFISDNSQMSGLIHGIYALRSSSLRIADSRPQSSGDWNVKVEDTGFFSMVGGSCDSADISTGPGDAGGIWLIDVNYVVIDGVIFYSNGLVADVLLETTAGQTMLSATVAATMHKTGGVGKSAILVRTAGTTKRLNLLAGSTVDNSTEPPVTFEAPTGAGTLEDVIVHQPPGAAPIVGRANVSNLQVNEALTTIVVSAAQMSAASGTPDNTPTNRHAMWNLDAAAAESVGCQVKLPADWNTYRVRVRWVNKAAGAGVARLRYDVVEAAVGATIANPTTGSPGNFTAGAQNVIVESQLTSVGVPPTSGEPVQFVILRDAANAADTLANDIGLMAVLFIKVT